MGKTHDLKHPLWQGPLRSTTQHRAIYSTRCVGLLPGGTVCHQPTINGEFLCYRCKDPDGYTDRLRHAQQQARQRCLEAYPVCKHCGRALSPAQVSHGHTAHERRNGECLMSYPSED